MATLHDHFAIATALREHGACALVAFPEPAAGIALGDDLRRLQAIGALGAAAIGQGEDQHLRVETRGDSTLWLDDAGSGEAATAYLLALGILRVQLNRQLFLGAEEVEAHYARYPAGTFYRRHSDRFHGSDARVLSLVSYLNDVWLAEDGGALRLYLPRGSIDVMPSAGTSIIFLSEIEHEVLPATRERLSIAAWMRKRVN